MTTDASIIEKLQLELAGMTQPCPCLLISIDTKSNCCDWCIDSWVEMCADIDRTGYSSLSVEVSHENCQDCNGSGVVPMIPGSRRECANCGYTKVDSHCKGRGWMPNFDRDFPNSMGGMEVLAWMLEKDGSRVELSKQTNAKTKEPLVECHWDENERWQDIGMEQETTPEAAILLAAIAGAGGGQDG